MELNELLIWVVGVSCVTLIARVMLSTPAEMKGWLIISVSVLVLMAATWAVKPKIAGFVGGGAWAVTFLIPLAGMARMRALVARHRLGDAAKIAAWIRLLHPVDGWWQMPALLRAQHSAECESAGYAASLLEPLRQRGGSVGRSATHSLFRIQRRWADMVQWIGTEVGERVLRREPALVASYLRALGEMGQLRTLLTVFERYQRMMDGPTQAQSRSLARLNLFAFMGKPRQVEVLLSGALVALPDEIKQFWIGTAEMAAGDAAAAEARFTAILPLASVAVREGIEHRRANPPADPSLVLDDHAQELLTSADQEREQEEKYQHAHHPKRRRPIVTWSLVAINAAVFMLEILSKRGSTDWLTLYRLGAATPYEIIHSHQWWRIVTANFLHFGAAHLVVNMLGLVILGPFVEHMLGHVLYAVIYMFSGCAGMSFVMGLAWYRQQPTLLVGASAAIMGLVGATAAILLIGWVRDRANVARRRLGGVVAIVAMQIIFDHFSVQVSGAAHMAGMFAGFVVTLPILFLLRSERRRAGFDVIFRSPGYVRRE